MNTAKFVETGVNYLYDTTTIEDANKSFKRSCRCCCTKNMPLDCDKCGIAQAHHLITAYFNDNNKE